MQYTLRNIPKSVDKALRAKSKTQGKSLNDVAVEMLKSALGVSDDRRKKRDLSDIAGTMTPEDAEALLKTVAEMDAVDMESRR
jgi:plasmid stability protein